MVHDVRGDRVVVVTHPLALGQKSETIGYSERVRRHHVQSGSQAQIQDYLH